MTTVRAGLRLSAIHSLNSSALCSYACNNFRALASARFTPLPSSDRGPSRHSLLAPRSTAPGAASTTEVSQPVMPDSELEQAAQRVRQLEAEAIAMHDLAQRLNKEGRYEEAQAAYAAMHQLEDQASHLAARVGCVACVLGDPGQQEGANPSLCNLDPEVLMPYEQLHPVLPWHPPSGQTGAQQQQPSDSELSARALACVVGSALADAAAMGVHWVYDLAVLDEVEQERRKQVAASTSASSSGAASAALEHPTGFGLEFTEPPRSPFYAYASGRNSPYGEQTLVLLRSLAEGSGGGAAEGGGGAATAGLHCGHYAALFMQTFGPESSFDGYRDVSTKGFLRNYGRGLPPPLSGAVDAQANCIARLAPLVAAFANTSTSTQHTHLRPACGDLGQVASNGHTAASATVAPGAEPNGVTTEQPSGPPGAAGAAALAVACSAPGHAGGDWDAATSAAVNGRSVDMLLHGVELATRVTQNTDAAVAWAAVGAVVLELILLGSTAEAAVRHVIRDLESPQGRMAPYVRDLAPEIAAHMTRVLELRTTPVPAAMAALGRNCHMPNALQTPLQVVLYVEHLARGAASATGLGAPAVAGVEAVASTTGSTGGDAVSFAESSDRRVTALPTDVYVRGVRLAVREGGCCASRAAYVGACLGAMIGRPGGAAGLPEDWLARYPALERVWAWAEKVVAAKGLGEMAFTLANSV